MPAKVKLETHQVELRKRGDKKNEPLNLWDIDGSKLTFISIFLEYITWLDTAEFADSKSKKVFAFDGDPEKAELSRTSTYQTGRFEYGEFGIANQIKNIKTKRITHRKTGEESEVYPLYFCLHIPEGEKQGIFVLQRYGNVAMLTQLKNTFSKFISEKYHEYIVSIDPLTPIEILKEYIRKGSVEEITLKRKDIPDDDADRLIEGGLISKPESIVVKITGENLLSQDTLFKWLNEKQAAYIVQDLAKVGLDGEHKTTITLNVNGTPREIDFGDTGKIRPYIDIHTDSLLDFTTGHPIFEEINRIAKQYAKDILESDK